MATSNQINAVLDVKMESSSSEDSEVDPSYVVDEIIDDRIEPNGVVSIFIYIRCILFVCYLL